MGGLAIRDGARRHEALPRRAMLAAWASAALLTTLGWAALAFEASTRGGGRALLEALCRPALPDLASPQFLGDLAVSAGLWTAMSLAMMIPAGATLFVAYAERAGETEAVGRRAASPVWLVLGYAGVWVAASTAAALVQAGLAGALAAARIPAPAIAVLGGAALGAAGLYQFSALKLGCLHAGREPVFPQGSWVERPPAVLGFGLRQGFGCVVCCGPLMAALAAVGAMNLVWTALVCVLVTAERMLAAAWLPRAIGAALVAAGLALSIGAVGAPQLARLAGLF